MAATPEKTLEKDKLVEKTLEGPSTEETKEEETKDDTQKNYSVEKTHQDPSAKRAQKAHINDTMHDTQPKVESKDSPTKEEIQEPISGHFYTPGSLGNVLSWGDQPIPHPIEEVTNLEYFTYDRKMKSIVKRTQ
jgi:hypothetical protein